MKNRIIKFIAAFLILPVSTLSQTGGDFSITKSVIGGGTQSAAGGSFSISATVGQAIAGTTTEGGDFSLDSGFWTIPVSGVGTEGDVAPRPGGDNSILSNDVVQMRRYFNQTAIADTDLGEFQRADSAPRSSSGDGILASNDIVQTRRYQNGADTQQQAAGPIAEDANPFSRPSTTIAKQQFFAPRELRVESTTVNAGQTFTLNIRVDAMGDEAEYGFRLNYQASKLSNPIIGAGNAGATVRACNTAVAGVINCSVGGFPNDLPGSEDPGIGEITAGNNQVLITVTFNVLTNAAAGASNLTFTNVNTSNDNADLLKITSVNGLVNISSPTAATVFVSGRILAAEGGVRNATILMTAPDGTGRSVKSSSFGNYRFEEVAPGATYVFVVLSRRFSFAPQTITVTENVTELNFTASP